jgi:hypothetical protein
MVRPTLDAVADFALPPGLQVRPVQPEPLRAIGTRMPSRVPDALGLLAAKRSRLSTMVAGESGLSAALVAGRVGEHHEAKVLVDVVVEATPASGHNATLDDLPHSGTVDTNIWNST